MATAAPTTELGNVASWATLASGWDDGEPEPSLMWPKSVAVYDRMRRYSQIRAVLWALTLPLRRPIWALDGEGCRPELVAKLSEDIDLPILGGAGSRGPSTCAWPCSACLSATCPSRSPVT
jgi:hypothetical protein